MSGRSFGLKILDRIGITTDLPLTEEERKDFIVRLLALNDSKDANRQNQKFLFDHFYMNLDVLDNKTNSIIQFVSVLMATNTASVAYFLSNDGKPFFEKHHDLIYLLIPSVVCSFLAVPLLLAVEKVHWFSYDDLDVLNVHARRLLDVRNKRTIRYRLAWWLSIGSLTLLFTMLTSALSWPIWLTALAIVVVASAIPAVEKISGARPNPNSPPQNGTLS